MLRFLSPAFCVVVVPGILLPAFLSAEPIAVRHRQGSAHGFVVLKTLGGQRIATGDMTQAVSGDRVTSRLVFRFQDGSLDDDVTIFTQRRVFRLLSDHHIQHGPSFPSPTDIFIDAVSGEITTHTKEGKIRRDHLDLPADVANGLPPNLLMNFLPSAPETKLSFVAPTEKPRLIHLSIKPEGEARFIIGGTKRMAINYVLHVELGGLTGVIAPLVGKQPTMPAKIPPTPLGPKTIEWWPQLCDADLVLAWTNRIALELAAIDVKRILNTCQPTIDCCLRAITFRATKFRTCP